MIPETYAKPFSIRCGYITNKVYFSCLFTEQEYNYFRLDIDSKDKFEVFKSFLKSKDIIGIID